MGWSEVVHQNRKRAALTRAREELPLRKRGYDIELGPDAHMSALAALVGVLSGAVWWRKGGRTVQGQDWQTIPGLQQLLELLNLRQKQPRSTTRGKAKPKQSTKTAVISKAAAASSARASSSSSSSSKQQQQQQPAAVPPVQRQVSMVTHHAAAHVQEGLCCIWQQQASPIYCAVL